MTRKDSLKTENTPAPTTILPVWTRVALSVLILGQLLAVFVPPFTFCTSAMGPDRSPVAVAAMRIFEPYADLTFLNHGYAFFAPDPGPSHLVRAHLEYQDGRPGEDVIFPDRRQQWPRLLYHRHFMLSESLNTRFVPPSLTREVPVDSESYRVWQRQRRVYESLWGSFEHHLAATPGVSSAVLTRIEHRQPTPDEFERDRMRIDDPRLYVDLPESVPLSQVRP